MTLRKDACPLKFTKMDIVNHEEQYALWARSVQLEKEFLGKFGQSHIWDGRISHDQYEAGKTRLRRLQEDFIAQHSSNDFEKEQWTKNWPSTD